jgi:hypothetical protein
MSALSIAIPEHCRYCGYPIGAFWPYGARQGYRYADGTPICQPCHSSAVKDDAALLGAWRFAVNACTDLGLCATWGDVKVRLRDKPQLAGMAGGEGAIGLARSRRCGAQVESDITILYGMPQGLAIKTLAHEAGHVWCHEHQVAFSPSEVEEGFCNVVACLVVQQLPKHLNPQERIDSLFADPHPVYGVRFRQEWAKVEQLSWPLYLKNIR